MGNINFKIENKESVKGGTKVTIRFPNSDRPFVTTNELPVILHAINGSSYSKPIDEESSNGFAYSFGRFIF